MTSPPDLTPVPPSDQPGGQALTVRGGVGSIRFQWEELATGSQQLGQLADDLRRIAYDCGDIQWQLQILLLDTDVAGAGTGPGAVASIDTARVAVAHSEDALRETAGKITLSRVAYETADALAQLEVSAARMAADKVEGDLRKAISTANAAELSKPAPITVTRASPAANIEIDASVHTLLQRIESVNATGPGVFEVLEVDGPRGRVFLVVIPGTQGSSITATGNPFDPTGVVEAVHQDSAFVTDAVLQALKESGAQPNDQLMIVGHSQGGMHAANIAGNPRVQTEYDLRMVLTAGAPTGREASSDATYLHLEHADDWVPKADAQLNPDERNRVTVTLHNPPVVAPGDNKGLGPAHRLDTYLAGARTVDRSQNPSVLAAVGVLGAAIGSRTSAVRHVFTLTPQRSGTTRPDRSRRPEPNPRPGLPPGASPVRPAVSGR